MEDVSDLSDFFLEAVEKAAIASARWRGKGDKIKADHAAVEAMRKTFDKVPFDGRVAIGEGERDEAPMLYIGEQLGNMIDHPDAISVDIAVDPLECTNNCAYDKPNSIAVLAAAPRGTLLHAPDCYMDKIAGGPELLGKISLEGDVKYNIEQTADALDKPISDVEIVSLDRERHASLFEDVKQTGARLNLMSDGDISAAIWAAQKDGPFDLLLGIGAAPEGVISAAALRGLGGCFEGKLIFRSQEEEKRASTMIDDNLEKIWRKEDLCKSDDSVFVASGVCDGYLPGVQFIDSRALTHSELIDVKQGKVSRFERTHIA